jgi:hypothetical protein
VRNVQGTACKPASQPAHATALFDLAHGHESAAACFATQLASHRLISAELLTPDERASSKIQTMKVWPPLCSALSCSTYTRQHSSCSLSMFEVSL